MYYRLSGGGCQVGSSCRLECKRLSIVSRLIQVCKTRASQLLRLAWYSLMHFTWTLVKYTLMQFTWFACLIFACLIFNHHEFACLIFTDALQMNTCLILLMHFTWTPGQANCWGLLDTHWCTHMNTCFNIHGCTSLKHLLDIHWCTSLEHQGKPTAEACLIFTDALHMNPLVTRSIKSPMRQSHIYRQYPNTSTSAHTHKHPHAHPH